VSFSPSFVSCFLFILFLVCCFLFTVVVFVSCLLAISCFLFLVSCFSSLFFYPHSSSASNELAQRDGAYSSYEGSPMSKGIFQFDMWNVTPSDLWDWESLRASVKKHGVRNSLMVAPMPTASTSQILGNNEW
jgi:hypothetical protein